MSDTDRSTTTAVEALPERMRAHAAAKALGMTSKELLASLADAGVEVKSAQSTVTRQTLLTWANARESGQPSAAPAAAVQGLFAEPEAPKADKPAKTDKPAKGDKSAKSEKQAKADKQKAETSQKADKPAKADKAAKADKPAKAGKAEKAGTGDEPETSRPELPAIAIVTGEVGTAEPQPGRRRRSQATPSFSPLFLSVDEKDTPAPPTVSVDGDAAATTAPDAADGAGPRDEDDSDGGNRRRRRGRRGRGRGRGDSPEQNDAQGDSGEKSDATATGDSTEKDGDSGSGRGGSRDEDTSSRDSSSRDEESGGSDSDHSGPHEDASDDSDEQGGGGRRRRRRRRRRGGGGSDESAQQDGGQHGSSRSEEGGSDSGGDREPRRQRNRGQGGQTAEEVQGISGSTRLEAKRQRRRDGREAGRRRQPILSEAQFLARREAVDRVMVVREKSRSEGAGVMTQVGVLEDGVLVEHFVTTESARSMVGNVYLGRVQNVLPSMEAAFVDIGRGRNGVLYAGEVNWDAAGLGGRARRIEQALRPGDLICVQVTKDPIGQKGARLTTQISLAGRFLVYVPDGTSTGISRKLPDTERRRLKAILKDVVPDGSGVIIRTAAEGVSEEEIGRDVARLAAQWESIRSEADSRISSGSGNPTTLYEEPDLLVKVVRDLFNEDFSKLVIEGGRSWETVHEYVSRVAPDMLDRLEKYENPDVDVFATYRVDEQLAKALERKVWLPSGGSLVIDRTEAMTVIDVNTGKYTGSGGNLEETVTRNNLEAAEEIVRQLRLRDVGGMVIVDFIDMVLESNRDLVLRRLTEALGRDRTRHQVSEVTSLGLVQLTRKKLGTGLVEAFSTPCEHCQGRGLVIHSDPVHTESHNAEEPGTRRGRKRGRSGAGTDQPQAKAARADAPSPAAHPAIVALHRHDDEQAETAKTETPASDTATSENHDAASSTDRSADAPGERSSAGRSPRRSARKVAEKVVEVAEAAAETATEVVAETVSAAADAVTGGEDTDRGAEAEEGTAHRARAPRRRATTGRAQAPAGAPTGEHPAPEPATPAPEPVSEATPEPLPESAPVTGEGDGPAASSAPRRRRRATRRPAGSTGVPAETTAVVDRAAAVVAEVPAAPLVEAPPAVAAEPRTRPARRRATRSSSGTAPTTG